jgi:hypothetical protein
MSLIESKVSKTSFCTPSQSARSRKLKLPLFLHSWEFYLITLVAGFLRLYQLGTGEFDADQARLFALTRLAVTHGLWPVVANHASIGIENPPIFIYLLMLPASITGNPMLATIMNALLDVLAVLFTYIFVRRYYGRLAGTIAAFLYAAAAKSVEYSRFIWQPNALAPFVVLFVFALFVGVVDRRKGWFIPAVILLGITYQLHETSLLLVIPFVAALILSPGTVRLRDIALAALTLVILFSPYILWEFISNFTDISIFINSTKNHSLVANTAIYMYRFMLSPNGFTSYFQVPAQSNSLLHLLGPILQPLRYVILLSVVGGMLMATLLALLPGSHPASSENTLKEDAEKTSSSASVLSSTPFSHLKKNPLWLWWTTFRANPYRCGLALLVIWQVVPLLILLQQTLYIFPYYLIMLLPGPYILIGIFLAVIAHWLRRQSFSASLLSPVLRYGMYAFSICFILAQVLTCSAALLDVTNGTYVNIASYNNVATYNTLGSLQDALNSADQVAQSHHIKRVYIATDTYIQDAMQYLATQMKTPATLFDDSQCLVLPPPSAGPALLLVNPYAQLTLALLRSYASATLVAQPPRLGTLPFSLYIVRSTPVGGHALAAQPFKNNLQLLSLQRERFQLPTGYAGSASSSNLLVSRWTMLRSIQPAAGTTYSYTLNATMNSQPGSIMPSLCTFTSMQPGDQLFDAFTLPTASPPSSPTSVTIEGNSFLTDPYVPTFGPLRLETDQVRNVDYIPLQTTTGARSLTAPVS